MEEALEQIENLIIKEMIKLLLIGTAKQIIMQKGRPTEIKQIWINQEIEKMYNEWSELLKLYKIKKQSLTLLGVSSPY